MNKLTRFLFPNDLNSTSVSLGLFIIRIVFGAMMMTHGWGKLTAFDAIAPQFMGGCVGLGLVVFAEFFCAMGIITGFLFRLALIPLIINMGVAFFVAHKAVLVGEGSGEMALLYLAVFIVLMFTGAGKFSVDNFIANRKNS